MANEIKLIERRNIDEKIEYRAIDDKEENKKLRGYAAVFNRIADLYWFDEEILPGAFTNAIKSDDIRALVNHDGSKIIGRNIAQTLHLTEDKKGLFVDIDPSDTTIGRDIIVSVERGDVTGMSFGFLVNEEKWISSKSRGKNKNDLRQLIDVSLRDVSIVTYPAYAQTSIKYRSEERSIENIYKNRYDNIENNLKYYRRYFELII